MSDAAQSNDGPPEAEARQETAGPSASAAPAEKAETPEPAKAVPAPLLRLDESFFSERETFTAARKPAIEPAASRRDWGRIRAAASLAAVVAIGAAAAAAHVHALRVANAGQAQTRTLAHRLDAMTARLESLESNRSRDELAGLRKLLSEIKAGAASTRDVGGAVGQLAQRVDKLEKEQGARLDKLGDRIDRDAAARLADVTARLDKLEAKAAASPIAVAVAPAKPSPTPKASAAKADTGVSLDPTGSVEKPRPTLHRFYLSSVHNGYAMIDSPSGEFAVAPGDVVPGGGRVLRIERHGRDWVVVTTQGQIVAED